MEKLMTHLNRVEYAIKTYDQDSLESKLNIYVKYDLLKKTFWKIFYV